MLIRPAQPDDAMAVAQVHVRAWQVGYRQLLPGAYLEGLRAEERAQRYTFADASAYRPQTLVAIDAGAIRGFATVVSSREQQASGLGELCALYVDPDWWNHGAGAALVLAARSRLSELGARTAILWLLKGNIRAERFYRIDGWAPDGLSRTESVWGVTVDEVRYQRKLDTL
jgi:GNAT superfamily N-acetyltransferase